MALNQDSKLNSIVERLTTEFDAKKIYLFGSHARGEANSDSDYDLLVLVEDSQLTRFERDIKARKALRSIDATFDIFVYTQAEFDEWKDELSSIPETALNEGRELRLV